MPEIISKMVAFTKQHRIVISDLHYAIQPKADTTLELKFYESIVKGLDVGPYIFENSNQEPDDFHRKFIAFLEPQ